MSVSDCLEVQRMIGTSRTKRGGSRVQYSDTSRFVTPDLTIWFLVLY